ncbi:MULTISPECIES: DUF465 domain-containing protein [Pseudomonas]|jgi:uncharacterized protein YdcH (DUF465 family)|uniref:DUF465 domain-containing protein n=1 Tax=Pseudomonas syringae TaxID=317 RepID=A0A085V361_PSESX|nr:MULTISPECIES: DUF465 domain-containing protein [Pseudomonas]EPJ90284.1 hypothetical protein CFII64_00035 [Pseudomonas sp. CFII64]KFE49874.1 hypothetical protein IV02_18570 [Pseudomonas syringae]
MPVKHDLYKDLGLTKEQVAERTKTDRKLNQLLSDYGQIDTGVLDAESGSAGSVSDDELKKLKEKRLLIKDKIVQRLTSPE